VDVFRSEDGGLPQIGNAFPPPVAAAVAGRIKAALSAQRLVRVAS
jgi:site-specific DNA-cytosine methylase